MEEEQPLFRPSYLASLVDSELFGRRVSLFLERHIPNYGLNASLDEAWAFFEKITLPRRMSDGAGGHTKAPLGTKTPSTLYPAWRTPQRELRDFGTGIAVYFETLRALVVICLIAGCIYTPTFRYYGSDVYSADQDDITKDALRGSLICSETEWVPCPNCTSWDVPSRIAHSSDGGGLTFVLKNACAPLRWQEGLNHILVILFLIVAIVALGFHQKKMELQYDEDLLTASDFSICVKNPPDDATDPEEWKKFFSQFGDQVVYCTVALDNDKLVKALTKRRARLQKASFKMRDLDTSVPLQEIPESLAHSNKLLYKKLVDSETKCRELSKETYAASAVFVTFDTEKCQRTVLTLLSVGHLAIATNDTTGLAPEHLFRGNLVLDIDEAKEPSVIRWKDLNTSMATKVAQRTCTGVMTVGLIVLGFIAVRKAFQFNVNLAAFLIAILNIVVPNIFKQVNRLENHAREGSYQASLYAKISVFRWVNTAIVTTLIKPFTMTISADETALIPAVYAVLKAEIVTAPILHMCDIVGNFKRFVLAPRAANQTAMNSYFRGSIQSLGEKYTNMTKIIFLCFFYAVIFPSAFFFGAFAIAATYMTDKFLLLRSWAPLPKLGDDVAKLSRRVFFPLSLLTLAVMSEFYWSAYPFDDVCDSDMVVSHDSYPAYIGSHSIKTEASTAGSFQVTVKGDGTERLYRFCDQDYVERMSALLQFFHAEKDDWMSRDQMALTFLFGLFCVAILVIVAVVALVYDIWPDMKEDIAGEYSTMERDSGERYSDQERIKAYVPEVSHLRFSYPLLACDISQVEPRHIGWTDPLHTHEFYDMSKDVAFLLGGELPANPVLSAVGHWTTKSVESIDEKAKNYGSMSPWT